MREIHYYKKSIFKYLFLLAMTAAAMYYTQGAGFAIIIPFALLSLAFDKPEEFYFYLLLFCSMVVANPRLVRKGAVFFMEQRVVLLLLGSLLAIRLLGQRKSPLVLPFAGLLIYLVYMALSSLSGWNPLISYLKLVLFLFVYLAYFCAANMAAEHPRENLAAVRSVVLSVAVFFLAGSVALIPFPSISQMQADMFLDDPRHLTSLFMGMAAHSQCLGPIVSGLAVILFTDLIFGVREWNWLYIILLMCCPILIWKTSSRTAMGTFVAGILFASYFFMKARWVGNHWKQKVMSILWFGGIVLAVMLVFSGSMREKASDFIRKGRSSTGNSEELSIENLISSRRALYDVSINNFKKSPLFGNGFQVSEEMTERRKESLTSVLSAPIEKGVWVSAVLEEGGMIGFVIFCFFFINVIAKMIKYRAFITASVFFVFLVSNMGEFTFFSMSYIGGFMWALVFAAVALDATRSKAEFYAQQELLQRMREEEQMSGIGNMV